MSDITLPDFILARVAQWEAMARECAGVPWVMLKGVGASQVLVDPAVIREEKWRYGGLGHVATTSHDGSYAAHIAAHDPARVLAQCAAYRSIVEQADEATSLDIQVDHEFRVGRRDMAEEPYVGDLILRALGSIWADHADYRDEWRP